MINDEFDCYVKNSIVPLSPYLVDRLGKQVLLKVDSGLECNGRDLILKAQFQGVYIYPGLPNATLVQQETDISHGPFKNVIRNNLKRVTSACFDAGTMMKLGQLTFWTHHLRRNLPLVGNCMPQRCPQGL
jgi:hypothetical protein